MTDCISCRSKIECKKIDAADRLLMNCQKCGTYDISRPAISRVKRNRSEMRRLVTALGRARVSNKILVVTVVPGTGLKFKDDGEVS